MGRQTKTVILRAQPMGDTVVGLKFEDAGGERLDPKELLTKLINDAGIPIGKTMNVSVSGGGGPVAPEAEGKDEEEPPYIDWEEVLAKSKDTEGTGNYYTWFSAKAYINLHRRIKKIGKKEGVWRKLRNYLDARIEDEVVEVQELLQFLDKAGV
jgi:hypothetical protein